MAALFGVLDGAPHCPSVGGHSTLGEIVVSPLRSTPPCAPPLAARTAGDEITATRCPWITLPTETPTHTVVTYDGSVAPWNGVTRAGAAAILWGPIGDDGQRKPVAEATSCRSGPCSALEAEAQASRPAMDFLLSRSGSRVAILAGP